jgi:hypothetical protein
LPEKVRGSWALLVALANLLSKKPILGAGSIGDHHHMTQTYKLECPGCEKEFQIEADPAIAFVDGGDLITCPLCKEEWEWDHQADEDPPLMLMGDDEEEEDDDDETPGRLDDDDEDDDFTDEDEEDDEYRV